MSGKVGLLQGRLKQIPTRSPGTCDLVFLQTYIKWKGATCRSHSAEVQTLVQDGAGAAEGPARKKRKRSSGAGLKELGLTSDDEEDSDDEWGSSGGDDDDDDPDDGGEVDAGPIGATHPTSPL